MVTSTMQLGSWFKKGWTFSLILFWMGISMCLFAYTKLSLFRYGQQLPCFYQRNRVFFLAIPKTGTSTLKSVLYRYAITHNQVVVFTDLNDKTPVSGYSTGTIMASSNMYNPRLVTKFLPIDTSLITAIRHPLDHLDSRLRHSLENTENLSLVDHLGDLSKLKGHRSKPTLNVLDYNPIARQFGLVDQENYTRKGLQRLISDIRRDFTKVLLFEYLDESLVMLKRRMCWSLNDILYNSKFKTFKSDANAIPYKLRAKHRQLAKADYAIYDHFSEQFNQYLSSNVDRLQQEVYVFQTILNNVNAFCNAIENDGDFIEVLPSVFNKRFTFKVDDCMLLLSTGSGLSNILRRRQNLSLELFD